MDARKLADIFNPQTLAAMFNQLPSGQRNVLADHGTPEQWSQKIGEVLQRRTNLPDNFNIWEPSMQIGWVISTLLPPGSDPVRSGITSRLTELAAAAAEVNRSDGLTPSQKVRSLIEETDETRGNSGRENSLDSGGDLDLPTINKLTGKR